MTRFLNILLAYAIQFKVGMVFEKVVYRVAMKPSEHLIEICSNILKQKDEAR